MPDRQIHSFIYSIAMCDNNIADTLKTIKALTSQQLTLANKVMSLKRQLAGKSANIELERVLERDMEWVSTPKAAPAPDSYSNETNEPKRGRGRPKKNTTVTSIINQIHIVVEAVEAEKKPEPGIKEIKEATTPQMLQPKNPSPTSIYRYNNISTDANLNLVYVIEDDDLFIRDDNGMLYDVESRNVIGWYNPYASGCSINWLYR